MPFFIAYLSILTGIVMILSQLFPKWKESVKDNKPTPIGDGIFYIILGSLLLGALYRVI